MSDTRPSLMPRKCFEDNDRPETSRQHQTTSHSSTETGWPRTPFRREYCFLYGTLMDPHTLSQVLRLSKSKPAPVMRRARVIGYDTKLWGAYPVLIDGEPLHSVDGMACEILSRTQLDRLAYYETDKYRLEACLIELWDGNNEIEKTIEGVTFMWNGRQEELREGSFDLKEWKKEKQLRDLDSL